MRLLPKKRERRDDSRERAIAKLTAALLCASIGLVFTLGALASYEERKIAQAPAEPTYNWKLERWADEKLGVSLDLGALASAGIGKAVGL